MEITILHEGFLHRYFNMASIELHPITETGKLPREVIDYAPSSLSEVAGHLAKQFVEVGYLPPWIGYVAVQSEQSEPTCVGLCGFKGPPTESEGLQRVEIAYFTLPEYEGRGYGAAMGKALVELAYKKDSAVVIAAQTLREDGPSTTILKKLGFIKHAELIHPEDGEIWEWRLL
jgi:ribosomal-protein-alanine N-acetyltransferase